MLQFCILLSHRFRHIVHQEKRKLMPAGEGYDSIILLQSRSCYLFCQGSHFLGQGGPEDKCYVFKMSTRGPTCGVDLINCMCCGSGGGLSKYWVLFDHTHWVFGWSTMACHVYDPRYDLFLSL